VSSVSSVSGPIGRFGFDRSTEKVADSVLTHR